MARPDPTPRRKTVLFIGPLPEPVTGQSLACRVLVEELQKHYSVCVIDLSKRHITQRRYSLGRVFDVLGTIAAVWRHRRAADAIYLTVSQSYLGNLKDLLIYAVCAGRLDRMVIHLYGGAGLRRIMLTDGHPLRRPNEFFMRRLGAAIVEGPRQVPTFVHGVGADRLHVVPNFAEDALFTDVARIDRKFATTRPLRVLFLSNLLPGKGHLELVEAIRALEHPCGVELDVGGGFETEDGRTAFLRQIDGCARIRYHGVVHGAEKVALFQQAHVFCLPTYYAYEGQPLSILEAYAAGCAVITTDHSGIRDVFADQINGYQVPHRSAADLQTAIARAAADPARLREMALANLSAARERYRVQQFKDRMIPIIDRLATGGQR